MMNKIQISEAMLLWTPIGAGKPSDGKAIVVRHPDIEDVGEDMTDAFGACNCNWLAKTKEEKFDAIIKAAWDIVSNGEVKAKDLSDALSSIDGYDDEIAKLVGNYKKDTKIKLILPNDIFNQLGHLLNHIGWLEDKVKELGSRENVKPTLEDELHILYLIKSINGFKFEQ